MKKQAELNTKAALEVIEYLATQLLTTSLKIPEALEEAKKRFPSWEISEKEWIELSQKAAAWVETFRYNKLVLDRNAPRHRLPPAVEDTVRQVVERIRTHGIWRLEIDLSGEDVSVKVESTNTFKLGPIPSEVLPVLGGTTYSQRLRKLQEVRFLDVRNLASKSYGIPYADSLGPRPDLIRKVLEYELRNGLLIDDR